MLVRNRSGELLDIEIHNSNSLVDVVPVGSAYVEIYNGNEHDMRTDADPGHIWAYKKPRNSGCWKSIAYSKSGVILVKKSGEGLAFVNYSSVLDKWNGLREESTISAKAIEPAIEIAGNLLSALVTGVAAIGAKGAVPSGMMLGVGSLLLMGLGIATESDQPPAPPDLSKIEGAVKSIVEEALREHSAKDHANRLIEACNMLIQNGIIAHSQLLGKSSMDKLLELPAHDYWDFRDSIEGYNLDPNEFWNSLTTLYNNPDKARFVLPALFAGISARLQIWRLHDFIRHLDGARITDEDLLKFVEQIDRGRLGLASARDSLMEKIEADIKKEGVPSPSPEANELSRTMIFRYTGSETLEFVNAALKSLDDLKAMVKKDIESLRAGNKMQHYWKSEWDDVKRAPVPKRPGA